MFIILVQQWRGNGGLRVSAGTSYEEARLNALLASEILNCPEIQYGTHTVKGHGVVTIDRKRGRAFIGNKLSHVRKPSAYKGKGQVL